ncbi:MAG: cell envelope integrity protein TolA, partial [Rhodanobacteraceae bacterium]
IITQIPGGDLINVQVSSPCNADQVTRNSIESAVRKAAPLPYQGYEKVFQRSIRFNFRYDG